MALQTKGFTLSALPKAPNIPSNIGQIDVKEIYDGVQRGLAAFEAARRAPQSMALADAEMQAKTAQAPLRTRGVLAETEALEAQLPLKTAILAAEAQKAEAEASPQFLDAKLKHLLLTMNPSGVREFELLTAGLSPAEKEHARRIRFGIDPRTSSAAITYHKVVGADGVERFVAVDPRAVGAQVIGTGETYGSGVATPAAPVPAVPVAPTAPAVIPAAEQVAVVPAPAEAVVPPVVAAPVSATTPAVAPTQSIFQSPTIQQRKAQETTGSKTAEMQVEARAKLPKALTALATLDSKTARVEADIDQAISLARGTTTGYGSILKNLPATDARKLSALLTSIGANIGFDALNEMRQNSPTGGALGNVSDFETKTLQSTIAALDQALASGDLKEALLKVKEARREALIRTRNAYERDVDMFGVPPSATAAPAPTVPQAAPVWSDEKEKRLQELRSRLGK